MKKPKVVLEGADDGAITRLKVKQIMEGEFYVSTEDIIPQLTSRHPGYYLLRISVEKADGKKEVKQ